MSVRNTTIAISPEEKNELDQIAEDVFGESDSIPYGSTVSMLITEFRDN